MAMRVEYEHHPELRNTKLLLSMQPVTPQAVSKSCGLVSIGSLPGSGVSGKQNRSQAIEPEASGYDRDELCAICYTSELGSDPVVKLGCGHFFHEECVEQLLKHRWSTMQISFAFMACP